MEKLLHTVQIYMLIVILTIIPEKLT